MIYVLSRDATGGSYISFRITGFDGAFIITVFKDKRSGVVTCANCKSTRCEHAQWARKIQTWAILWKRRDGRIKIDGYVYAPNQPAALGTAWRLKGESKNRFVRTVNKNDPSNLRTVPGIILPQRIRR